MAEIRMKGLTKKFEDGTVAVDQFDLEVADGEFVVLVGPSGSGKSTALRMVAGLEAPTDGEIWIGDREVTFLTPRDRDVAMVFQNYALYPHMTVEENMGFGLKLRHTNKQEIKRRVREAAELLDIADLLGRRPKQLSGGQRQRVAMGRAIVREPQAFLMDEPLSNLDAKLRVQMRAEIAKVRQRVGVTTLYVTHDQTEAMTMGDRVVVMRDGHIEQIAQPQVLYERPANLFVAGFIGSPAMNLLPARVVDGALEIDGARVELASRPEGLPPQVVVGIRPEDLKEDPAGPLDVLVSLAEPLGAEVIAHFELAGANGYTARLEPQTRARPGERLRLAPNPKKLYLFDPTSGESLLGTVAATPAPAAS
jgi:multiple sugar transport system ATP-binding protein